MENIHFINIEYLALAVITFIRDFDYGALLQTIINIIVFLRIPALLLTLFLLYVIFYAKRGIAKLKKGPVVEKKAEAKVQKEVSPEVKQFQDRWSKVDAHALSTNSNDWRIAIIDADIMLGEALHRAGFRADSIGEQLKMISKGDLLTLDQAWEAHKARNMIAHAGPEFQLTERETKRVLGLFKQVFTELKLL